MNEYSLLLFDAIGAIGDDLIDDAEHSARKKPRVLYKVLSIAACVCLVVIGALWTLSRFDFTLGGNCSGTPGKLVDGAYWFHMDGRGVYRCEDGKSELILHTFFEDDWDVNSRGVYYTFGRSLYVKANGSEKSQRLYRIGDGDGHFFQLHADESGDVIFTLRKKTRGVVNIKCVVIDGVTGEVKAEYPDGDPVDYYTLIGNGGVYHAGSRTLERVDVADGGVSYVDIRENGVSVLPDGYCCKSFVNESDGCAVFEIWPIGAEYAADGEHSYLACRSDGGNVTFAASQKITSADSCVAGGYMLFVSGDDSVSCVDLRSGEVYDLDCGGCNGYDDFYYIASDGEYLYSTAPWNGRHACLQIVFDGDRPVSLALIDDNIAD